MSNLDTVIKDLVIANRILAREEVVDAYGHVSIRNPDNPKHFFLSRSVSPELVERDDIDRDPCLPQLLLQDRDDTRANMLPLGQDRKPDRGARPVLQHAVAVAIG